MNAVVAKRADAYDIAKGLGIIAVVFGHSGAPFVGFVSLYHMALFFFISGYFYKDCYTQEPLLLVKKRIKSLYLPFIQYGLFFGLLHNFLFSINIYTDQVESLYNKVVYFSSFREYAVNLLKILSFAKVEQILATLWFLPVLFIVNVLFVLTRYVIFRLDPEKQNLLLPVAIAALFCAGYVYYPEKNLVLRPVSIAMVVTSMYYFGYLFKKHESVIDFNAGYALACLAILLISFPYGSVDTGGHQFVSPPFYLASSLCGIYLNLYVAKLFTRESVVKTFLLFAGINSITIMALHFLAFKAVNYLQVSVYGLQPFLTAKHPVLITTGGWWLLYLTAGVSLPLLAQALYDRFKQAVLKNRR